MSKLLVLSGKGGTGKTTIALALINLFHSKAFADVDVDAPNLHLIVNPQSLANKKDFIGGKIVKIDQTKCIQCHQCEQACKFDAISNLKVNEYLCEGCLACVQVCPVSAIDVLDDISGETMTYDNQDNFFATAKLKMGRGNSGKLVTNVKEQLPEVKGISVIDGSPGIGCPVVASINGVDMVLIVTEPSLSGMADMERIIKTCEILDVKYMVCINRYDINMKITNKIQEYCKNKHITIVGEIPYDPNVISYQNKMINIINVETSAKASIVNMSHKIIEKIKEEESL